MNDLTNVNARLGLLAVFVAMISIGPKARAEDQYFMTVYGAQRPIINQPRYTHTWANFIRISNVECDPNTQEAQSLVISWMPATLEIHTLDLRPEVGVNLSMEKTLSWCKESRMEIAQFGPYRVTPELWNLAYQRHEQLERGELKYRASDLINAKRTEESCNCIYAVLDLDGRDPAFRPVTLGFGQLGSAFVSRRLSPYIIDRQQTYPWVNDRIGFCNYPTRQFGNKR